MTRNAGRSIAPAETVLGYSPFKLLKIEDEPVIVAEAQPASKTESKPPADVLLGGDALSVFRALVDGTTTTGDVPNPARWVKVADRVMPMETVARKSAPPVALARVALPPRPAVRASTVDAPIETSRLRSWVLGGAVAIAIAAAVAYWLWPETTDSGRYTTSAVAPPLRTEKPTPPTPLAATKADAIAASATSVVGSAPVNVATMVSASSAAAPKPTTNQPAVIDHGSCTIHIDADAPGSVVIVDGRVVGDAPAEVAGIYCGRRTRVMVANPRFAPWERWVVAEEGKPSRLSARLSRLTTAIAVTSTPSGAAVRVNGKQVAVTPAAIPVVADASTTIEVEFLGYQLFTKQLVPRAGATATIDAKLDPVLQH
jgi:hypothetical protein